FASALVTSRSRAVRRVLYSLFESRPEPPQLAAKSRIPRKRTARGLHTSSTTHDLLVQQAPTREIQHEPSRPKLERRPARRPAERVAAREDAPGEGGSSGRRSRDGQIDLLLVHDRPGEHDTATGHAGAEAGGPADKSPRFRMAEADLASSRSCVTRGSSPSGRAR